MSWRLVQLLASRKFLQGVHPRLITEGFEWANAKVIQFIETFKQPVSSESSLFEYINSLEEHISVNNLQK